MPLKYKAGNQKSQMICQAGLERQALGTDPRQAGNTASCQAGQPDRRGWKTQMPGEGHPVPREAFASSIWALAQSLLQGQLSKCKREGRTLTRDDQLSNSVKANCKCEFSSPSQRHQFLFSHKAKLHAWETEQLQKILKKKKTKKKSIKRHLA